MSDTPTKVIVNCTTGEESIVPLTPEEIAQLEVDALAAEERLLAWETEQKAKAEAKASALAKLAALGLTEEEAAAIAGA